MTAAPLAGVVVVAFEQAVAAPFATRQLADLGARVIKVERPDSGDFARGYDEKVHGLSSAFLWLNRGKESLTLDLKQTDGRAVLDRLLGACDVFVHNMSPAAARRAGLDPETLQRDYPRIVPCAISGYGEEGPLRDAKAYDLLMQGETGLMSLTGDADHMAKVGISIADISAGTYAFSNILAALLHRDRTGESLPVSISLFDSLAEWLGYPLYYTMYGGDPPPRMGTSHPTIAPYGAFVTGDGHHLLLAVQNDREWTRFCAQVIGDEEAATDARFSSHARRVEHRSQLDAMIAARFAELDREKALELLVDAEIAHASLNGIADLADHVQLVERDRWTQTPTPVGSVRTIRPPGIPGAEACDLGKVPALGEDTGEVLRWLDFGEDDIDRLHANGTV